MKAVRHSFQSLLLPVPVVCLIGVLLTDVTYWRTADMQWANFSVWLLTAVLIGAGLAVFAILADVVFGGTGYGGRWPWPRVVAGLLVLILSVINAFVHSRDAYTSVVPSGLALSGIVVAIMLASGVAARAGLSSIDTGMDR